MPLSQEEDRLRQEPGSRVHVEIADLPGTEQGHDVRNGPSVFGLPPELSARGGAAWRLESRRPPVAEGEGQDDVAPRLQEAGAGDLRLDVTSAGDGARDRQGDGADVLRRVAGCWVSHDQHRHVDQVPGGRITSEMGVLGERVRVGVS